jgi:ankyrin repeat protein
LSISEQEGQGALFIASALGHIDIMRLLLDRGANMNTVNNVSQITIRANLLHKTKRLPAVISSNVVSHNSATMTSIVTITAEEETLMLLMIMYILLLPSMPLD